MTDRRGFQRLRRQSQHLQHLEMRLAFRTTNKTLCSHARMKDKLPVARSSSEIRSPEKKHIQAPVPRTSSDIDGNGSNRTRAALSCSCISTLRSNNRRRNSYSRYLTSKLTCGQVSGAAVAKANIENREIAVTGNVRRMTRAASAAHC